MCQVADRMKVDEDYARGMVRLWPNRPSMVEFAQYALDIQKLRHAHEERCAACKREN
jgi:hypothetical protein